MNNLSKLLKTRCISYEGKVFRNIFTCSPSQDLFDDLCDTGEASLLHTFVELTSEIDHQLPQQHRPFQYGKIENNEVLAVFEKDNWSWGRFGDACHYGVWYSAEEEITSVYEAAWHTYRLARDNTFAHGEIYTCDRMMYQAEIASDFMVDLSEEKKHFGSLVHPSDYNFCHQLGACLAQNTYEILRTPSARKPGGICVPVFTPQVINDLQKQYYLSLHIHPHGDIGINSTRNEFNFLLHGTALENPYQTIT